MPDQSRSGPLAHSGSAAGLADEPGTSQDQQPTPAATNAPSPAIVGKPASPTLHESEKPPRVSTNTDTDDNASLPQQCPSCGACQDRIRSSEKKLAELEEQSREERHILIERSDALESKLKFLLREMTESARRSAASTTAGSVEKQIADKDEKIALLLSEGQTLAATEHRQRTLIRRLRSDLAERDKMLAALKDENSDLTSRLEALEESEITAESVQSDMEDLKAKHHSLQSEVNRLRTEVNSKDDTIETLELELERLARSASSGGRPSSEPQAGFSKQVAELEELATRLRAEKDRAAEKARVQVDELQKKLEGATEQGRQLKNEVQVLEGKLEAMRIVAEEASANTAGDAQAKLLRQVETLQSQYAAACENWQGIETSLTSRIAVLEKERDEISRKETETRRKAKDLVRCLQLESATPR
jgi:chromosome segregation ATPase